MKNLMILSVLALSFLSALQAKTSDLVVFSPTITEPGLLKSAMLRKAMFLSIDTDANTWKAISEILMANPNIDQVHLFLPASEGELLVDNTYLNATTVISSKDLLLLKGTGVKLLFYGSSLAEVAEGKDLIQIIAQITECEVAASTNTSAGSNNGGDWNLEYTSSPEMTFKPLLNDKKLKEYPYNF